jgi:hypothetical protein
MLVLYHIARYVFISPFLTFPHPVAGQPFPCT